MELLTNGNELVRTAQYYIKIVHEDTNLESAIVDMKKTQLKKSRAWMSLMSMQKNEGKTLPMFSSFYRLSSTEESNDKGDWFNWKITYEKRVSNMEVYKEAREMSKTVKSGELKITAPPTQDFIEDSSSKDDTIPF